SLQAIRRKQLAKKSRIGAYFAVRRSRHTSPMECLRGAMIRGLNLFRKVMEAKVMSSSVLRTGLGLLCSLRFRTLGHFTQSGLIFMAVAVAALLSVGSVFPVNTAAQAVYGSIAGTVIDASGGVVAEAKVTITDTGRNVVYTTTTNSSGAFVQS